MSHEYCLYFWRWSTSMWVISLRLIIKKCENMVNDFFLHVIRLFWTGGDGRQAGGNEYKFVLILY